MLRTWLRFSLFVAILGVLYVLGLAFVFVGWFVRFILGVIA